MSRLNPARKVIAGVKRIVVNDPDKRAMTQSIPIIDDALAQRIIDLAMRVAALMLSVGSSSKAVAEATLRITRAYGLKKAHVDVTFTSVTVSDHRDGAGQPITLMQVVQAVGADHQKLQRLQALVADIEQGMELHDAIAEFHRIRRKPFLYRNSIVVVVSALLSVSVAVMYRATWIELLVVALSALGASLTLYLLGRIHVPVFFSQIGAAIVLTAIAAAAALLARMGIEPFTDLRAAVIMSSGIILMLSGVAVVGAAQDAIDGFSLTATGRILDLTLLTFGLVIGIVAGLEFSHAFGAGLPLPDDVIAFGPWPFHLAGSMMIAAAVAVVNGGGARIVVVSAGLGGLAWLGYVGIVEAGLEVATASFGGAMIASFVGGVLAPRLHVPAVAVTTAAIIPLVPGSLVFRGLLGIVQAEADSGQLITAVNTLIGAALIGVGLASGATLGVFLASPIRARFSTHKYAFRPMARVASGAGTAPLKVMTPEPREIPTEPLPGPVAEAPHRGEEPPPITRPFNLSDLDDAR